MFDKYAFKIIGTEVAQNRESCTFILIPVPCTYLWSGISFILWYLLDGVWRLCLPRGQFAVIHK